MNKEELSYKIRLGRLATALGIPNTREFDHDKRYSIALSRIKSLKTQLDYYIKQSDKYTQLTNRKLNHLLEIDSFLDNGYFLISKKMLFKLMKFTPTEFCKLYDIDRTTLTKFFKSKRKRTYTFDRFLHDNNLNKRRFNEGIIKE